MKTDILAVIMKAVLIINCLREVLTKWGAWHFGEAGDRLASQIADPQDIYSIRNTVFQRTYERTEE